MTRTRKTKANLKNLLIINDDAEDIIALQSRLPSDMSIMAASQFQAHCLENFDYDLVILDNDANNTKESKGKETLKAIRKLNSDVRVVYTSFQPGHVPGQVYKTRGVEVIRTDTLPDFLSDNFGLKLRPVEKAEANGETSLVLTYNHVEGYPQGIYSGGKLIVVSCDKRAYQRAKKVLSEKVSQIYQNFEWRRDRDMIKNIFVYDGINGGEYPGQVAAGLGHDIRMRVNLLACGCQWERKLQFANSTYVNLFQVECGGDRTLGKVADVILGVKRPGVNYDKMKVPLEVITQTAERFRI